LDKKHYLCDVVELDEDDGGEEEDGGGDEQEHVAQVQKPKHIINMIHQRNHTANKQYRKFKTNIP
jgi:hypothetical protein